MKERMALVVTVENEWRIDVERNDWGSLGKSRRTNGSQVTPVSSWEGIGVS